MHGSPRLAVIAVALATVWGLSPCQDKPPTWPVNHNPVMSSAAANPTDMGRLDSTEVTILATDEDGDTLVYDWTTDLRLRIKGNPPDFPVKSHSFINTETFYPNFTSTEVETCWIGCSTRDRRGGVASRTILVTVHP